MDKYIVTGAAIVIAASAAWQITSYL